jgi:rod shape-determining protein MreD
MLRLSSVASIPMKQFLMLLLCGLTLILIQALPWNHIVPQMIKLNLSFVFVIFLALYRPSISSWLLAFLLGYALDTLSGAPTGLLPLINLLTFSVIRVARRFMLFEGLLSQSVLVFALSSLLDLSLLTINRVVFTYPYGLTLKDVLSHGLLVVVLSMPLFAFFNKRAYSHQGSAFKWSS